MHPVKFGIIGGGIAARFHLAACKKSHNLKYTAVYDIDEKNTKRIAKVYKLTPYYTMDDLLSSGIDAVMIAVPHYLHEKYVSLAAAANKHVLCEKPMATTLEGCDQMIEATRKANVKFMIAENHRFLPAHQWIKDAVQSDWIGKPFLVRSYEGVNEIPNLIKPGLWKGDLIKAGGGALMDMGAHKFATLQWILNDSVESGYAWLTKQCTDLEEKAEDNAMMFIKYKSGVIAETTVSFTVVTPPTNTLEIYGTQGSIIENHAWENPIRFNSYDAKMATNRGRWYEPRVIHGAYPAYYDISARIENEYFAECILNNQEPKFSPTDAKAAIATVLLGYLSAELGRSVTFDELMEVARTKGTKSILEGLGDCIQNNCIE